MNPIGSSPIMERTEAAEAKATATTESGMESAAELSRVPERKQAIENGCRQTRSCFGYA